MEKFEETHIDNDPVMYLRFWREDCFKNGVFISTLFIKQKYNIVVRINSTILSIISITNKLVLIKSSLKASVLIKNAVVVSTIFIEQYYSSFTDYWVYMGSYTLSIIRTSKKLMLLQSFLIRPCWLYADGYTQILIQVQYLIFTMPILHMTLHNYKPISKKQRLCSVIWQYIKHM